MSSSMESTTVIKVKYGKTLRRFNARVLDGKFDLNMDGLRAKILGLFKFAPNAELTMTYVDEDGDKVTLADDEDLLDVVRQCLNPLRITVYLSTERSDKSSSSMSGTSTPLRSPQEKQTLQNVHDEILNAIPEAIREMFMKHGPETSTSGGRNSSFMKMLLDQISISGGRNPAFIEMLLSRLSDYLSNPDTTSHGGTANETVTEGAEGSNAKGDATDVMHSDKFKKVSPISEPEPSLKDSKIKSQSAAGSSKGSATTIPGLKEVKAALDSVTESALVDPKPPSTSQPNLCKKSIKLSSPVSKSEITAAVKLVKSSSLSVPPVSNDVPADKNNTCDPYANLLPLAAPPPPHPFVPGLWTNLSSQPADKSGGFRNVLGSGPGNSSTSIPVPSPMGECPSIGMPVGNSSALPSQTNPALVKSRRIHGQGDMIFHRGVCCDGCGVHPITGPRFKSKVQDDYDLCTFCFGQMGNENDYTRMDRPMTYRHPFSFQGLHEFPPRPAHPHIYRCPMNPNRSNKLDSRFIQDMNVLDGTLMAPLTPFTKIWRMRNNGTIVWPQGTQLVWIGGDKLTDVLFAALKIPDAGLPVDKELDVAVDFVAPKHPGRYISYWRMASSSGQKFGQRVWVLIQVDASSSEFPSKSFRGFNLNLPPVTNGMSNPEIINVHPEPMVEDGLSELGITEVACSNRATNLVEPIVDLPIRKEHQMNFPTNDSLLVGGAVPRPNPTASASASSSSSSTSVSYPIIDLSEPVPFPAPPAPAPVTGAQLSPEDAGENTAVKETLLKDLEEMGFKQVDLNKEILRLNEYDLEKSVDYLCGVSEWNPILEELHEMGFCDEETNKKLLKKNNGSIKRVVMDLIAGEKM